MKKVLIVFLAGLVIISLICLGIVRGTGGDKIAVLPLTGYITGGGDSGFLTGTQITPGLLRNYLEKAEEDSDVKAIVLRINSPGGAVAAAQEMGDMIQEFKEETGKAVVVSMGDVAASGGYYISAYADEIIAEPGTITGSIGVIWRVASIDREQYLEVNGIDVQTITSPEGGSKDLGQLSGTELQELLQPMCDEVYQDFVNAIEEGRGSSLSGDISEIATGQPFTGRQAYQVGLVDQLGGLDDAIDRAEALSGLDDADTEWYGGQPSLLSLLFGFFDGSNESVEVEASDDYLAFLRSLEEEQVILWY